MSDDCNNRGSWNCHVADAGEDESCHFGEAKEYCLNELGSCHRVEHGAYIERSYSIAPAHAQHPLRLSLYVRMEDGPERYSTDRCRIWLTYNEGHDINNYDWECAYSSTGKVVIIDVPSSTTSDTLYIALGAYDQHRHCYFDSVALEYQLLPTPAPTAR
eukprot:274457_1